MPVSSLIDHDRAGIDQILLRSMRCRSSERSGPRATPTRTALLEARAGRRANLTSGRHSAVRRLAVVREAERLLSGRDYLAAAVDLLHRVRASHPTAGVWEAADPEWWWRKPRPTDEWDQLFWFVDEQPIAAAIATDWAGRLGLDIIILPDASDAVVTEVVHRGVERTASAPFDRIESLVADADPVVASLLTDAGFVRAPGTGTSAWMSTQDRPPVAPLAAGYRLAASDESSDRPHHYIDRNGPGVEQRLSETSLYRSDLDLSVVDSAGEVVAHGLFWWDPITAVGFVEPLGTDEAHRRSGLARHLLTAGLDRLASLGAERLKINYENDNPSSARLYQDVGFVPTMTTSLYVSIDKKRRPDRTYREGR